MQVGVVVVFVPVTVAHADPLANIPITAGNIILIRPALDIESASTTKNVYVVLTFTILDAIDVTDPVTVLAPAEKVAVPVNLG